MAGWIAVPVVVAAGCTGDRGPGAGIAIFGDRGKSAVEEPAAADLGRAVLDASPVLIDYELRQQVALDPSSVGQYYQRFPAVGEVLTGLGWERGQAHTFVHRTTGQVPATVTVQVDRFQSSDGPRQFLENLRRNGSPSLSHFFELAEPARPVDRPGVGEAAIALEAGLADRGITPRVVPVRYYAFRSGRLVGQIVVIRDGPEWPAILALAREQVERLRTG